jgi:hypothetical protein
MKMKIILGIGVVVLGIAVTYMVLTGDTQNKISRTAVSYLDGDYNVTFVNGDCIKTWSVMGGKVTSEPAKGYYFFWATTETGKKYVQTPIDRTFIEEK